MKRLVLFFPITLAALACGSDVHGQAACDALAQSPTPLTAGTSSAAPAAITASSTPYTIRLPTSARGFLRLSISADTALVAAFRSTGVLGGVALAGQAVTVGAPEPLEACASDIVAHHDLDLETAGDYVISLGPVVGDEAWMYLDVDATHEE